MEEQQRQQIKSALLKCADENEGKGTYTGHVIISSVCRSAVERIEELEKENTELETQIEKMKLCQNCRFESYDDMEEPCCNCSRLLGNIKRKGTSDKWEIMND